MSFKPGDRVVYPHHGAAVIEKKEKRKAFGEETEYLVLRMAHGEMTLAVPVDKADEVGMRWPISEEDVEDLFEVLAKRDVREPANWSRRSRTTRKAEERRRLPGRRSRSNLALRDNAKGCQPARSRSTRKLATCWSLSLRSPSMSRKTKRWRRSTALV